MDEAKLRELYGEHRLSMMQIATALGTTHARVLYWLKKYDVRRRSWSESTYAKLNPSGDPFMILDELTQKQQRLLLACLMLYWGEGRKGSGSVQIANLDPRVLQMFVKFLRQVCRVDEARLRISVLLHRSFDRSAAQAHWATLLGLPPFQVIVYHHRDERSKPKAGWSSYGIATLQFHNTRLKQWLMAVMESQIEDLLAGEPIDRTIRSGPRDGHSLASEPAGIYEAGDSLVAGGWYPELVN